jgi:hypothetical protein
VDTNGLLLGVVVHAACIQDHEELPEVSEAMVTLAMVRLMLHGADGRFAPSCVVRS